MIKRLIQIALILVLMVVFAAVSLVFFVDPNHYKDLIVTKVEDKLQRDFAIEGDISWRFWPKLGLALHGVSLGQAQAFSDMEQKNFAQIGEASIYVNIIPLLNKELEVNTLAVKDAQFYLLKRANGTSNWDDLVNSTRAEKTVTATEGHTAEAEQFNLSISEIAIENTHVAWDDQNKKQKVDLEIVKLNGALNSGNDNPLQAELQVDLQPQNIQLTLNAKGEYGVDAKAQRYEGKDLQIDMTAQGLSGFSGPQEMTFSVDNLLVDLAQDNFTVDDLLLKALGAEVAVNAKGENITQTPRVEGSASLTNLNLRKLAQVLRQPLNTADPNVLQKLNLNTTFTHQGDGFSMQPFDAQLDDTQIKGTLSVKSIANPDVKFNLNVDAINLDRYLSAKASADADAAPKTTAAQASTSADFPVEKIRALKIDGDLVVGSLTVSDVKITDITTHLSARNGIVSVAPFNGKLYSGTLSTTSSLNAQQATPRWNVDLKLDQIDMAPLLKQMANSEKFSGSLNLNTQVSASGTNSQSLMRTLDGKAAFDIDNGVLKGTDMGYWLAVGQGLLAGNPAAAVEKSNTKNTAFKEMTGTLLINQGLVRNNDLVLYNETLYTTGKGSINLPQQTIDYSLRISGAKETSPGVYQPSGVAIPVKVGGNLSNPSIGIDKSGIQELLIKGVQNEVKTQLQDQLQKALPIFGGSTSTTTDAATGAATTDAAADPATTTNAASTPEESVQNVLKGLFNK